ncbi:MAG: bifunctional metallophosphatase/5'-nucleotidase [Oscillibacter sp.]|nr:bifunctional metallophosphatase/5'-nucleotidase [Oscillibacter sp.]
MRKWNKLLALLLAMVMAFSLAATGLAEEGSAEESVTPYEVPAEAEGAIVILHTNDVHGGIEGYAKVAALKAMYEEAGATVFVMDAGDFIQGATYVSVSEGETAIELMNMVGYDVVAPGNHEFDYGYANLSKLVKAADFPVLAANITYNGELAFGDNITLTAEDGTKIGVFGLDTPETASKAHPAKIKGVSFAGGEDMYKIAQAQVDALADCDYVVCLGHLGIDDESAAGGNRSIDLLAKVTGIDVFIDGHSHSTLEQVRAATNGTGKVGDTFVTSTGTKLANIGVVTIKDGEITVANVNSETVSAAADDAIAARAAAIIAEIEEEYGATFATTTVKLNGDRDPGNRTEETNLGDLITDAMVWYATKDGEDLGVSPENVIAITNGGGIRASVEAGNISKNDINTVLPFGNSVAYVTVSGEDLLEVLEASTFCTPTAVGAFPQVAGIEFTIDVSKPYDQGDLYGDTTYYAPKSINRVTVNSVNGQDFDAEADYVVVTNDFTAAGGDTYYALTASESIVDTGTPLDVALMEYITEVLDGTVSDKYAEPAGRITIVEGAATEPTEPTEPEEPAATTFSDVSESNWHYEFVMKMAEDGVVNGYADGSFKPNDSVKWGEALKMVVSYVTGEEKAPVEGGTWASGYIAYVQENGIWEDEIDQNAVITREEMCVVLAKMLKVAASEKDSIFPDTDNAYVMALVDLGIIDGIDGSFQPDGALTRAQLCKILATIPEDLEAAAPAASDDAAEAETEGEAEGEAETEGDTESEGEAESEGETEGEEESKAA